MRQTRKVLTVPPNGQISIGKQWAGREVMVEVVDENQIVIRSGTFIPAHQETFYTKAAEESLALFDKFAENKPGKKTDLAALRRRLGKKD